MGNLGSRPATGKLDRNNPLGTNFWTVTFDPPKLAIQIPFEVYHIAISGPTGSSFQLYIDSAFYSNVARGDINDWDPSQPMHMRPGQTIYFYWNTGSGTAPMVSIFCREPSPL